MEHNHITLRLGDWSWNAAITGFLNIIADDKVKIIDNTVTIPVSCFYNFEEKYFDYFINTYKKLLPWHRIVDYKNTINGYRESDYMFLSLNGLKAINRYITDIAKRYLTSNSFKSAFELIGDKEYIEQLKKGLKKIKEPRDETIFESKKEDIVEEVEKQFKILDEIIIYCASTEGKRYIGAKNVIYSFIKMGWNGVCFLNPQTKIKDVYEDYKTYFVGPVFKYIQSEKIKNKYTCFSCGSAIKDLKDNLSFLNQSGFDAARKLSHVWNFVNDIAICPICKLIYSCLPAGFVYIGDRGLYVNINTDLTHNLKTNRKAKADILEGKQEYYSQKIYVVLVEALKEQQIIKGKYELADVQIIRYENETYQFNLLPEKTIKLIDEHKNQLIGMMRTAYQEGKERISIYERVLDHIFKNQNLFLFINKLLHYKLSLPKNCFFHTGHILDMLKINVQIIKNLGGIENMEQKHDYLKEARGAGFHLRMAYLRKDPNTGKIPSISYRLLNALKTGNRNMFMDVILNCYLYVGNPVPYIITEILREEDEMFSTIGYAFVACFIEEGKENKIVGKDNENIESERSFDYE